MATRISDAAQHRIIRDHYERMHRLANRADADGVRIVILHKTELHLAIDPHAPEAFAVNEQQCSCRDFGIWGACGHHALLLSELGQLPDPETEIGWPDEHRPVPMWERRSNAKASVVALKLVGD